MARRLWYSTQFEGAPSPKFRLYSLIIAVGVDFQSLNLCLMTLPIRVSQMIRSALVQGVTGKAQASNNGCAYNGQCLAWRGIGGPQGY